MRVRPLLLAAPLLIAASVDSSPDLGKSEGQCRLGETGPAFIVTPIGMKDRRGNLKLEVYPPNDRDLLQDDNILINSKKIFRRVEEPVPIAGSISLCVRIPGPGVYSLVLLHDRDKNHKYSWLIDGVGFSGNPKLGWSKPTAAKTRVIAGSGLNRISIVMNYHHGLFSVAPIKRSADLP